MDDVGQVLPRKLVDLLLDRQVTLADWLVIDVFEHVDDRQTLILGDCDVLHHVRLDVEFGPSCEVTQMPDGHVLRLWQVDLALTGEVAEALDLVREAAGELRRGDVLLRLTAV